MRKDSVSLGGCEKTQVCMFVAGGVGAQEEHREKYVESFWALTF